jgi:hypothetical protein
VRKNRLEHARQSAALADEILSNGEVLDGSPTDVTWDDAPAAPPGEDKAEATRLQRMIQEDQQRRVELCQKRWQEYNEFLREQKMGMAPRLSLIPGQAPGVEYVFFVTG